jgi:hypothetical protein
MTMLTSKNRRRLTGNSFLSTQKLARASASALEPLEQRVLMTTLTTIPYATLGSTSSQTFSTLGATASSSTSITPNAYDLGTGSGTASSPGGSSLNGWSIYASLAGTSFKYQSLNDTAGGTSVTTGGIYNYGLASSPTNRALGMVSTTTSGFTTIAAEFVNNTSTTISQVNINYTGEQWHDGTATGAKTLDFGWAVTSSAGT